MAKSWQEVRASRPVDLEKVAKYRDALLKSIAQWAALHPQEDEGDMSQMLVEHREWEQTRKAATSAILGDDDE